MKKQMRVFNDTVEALKENVQKKVAIVEDHQNKLDGSIELETYFWILESIVNGIYIVKLPSKKHYEACINTLEEMGFRGEVNWRRDHCGAISYYVKYRPEMFVSLGEGSVAASMFNRELVEFRRLQADVQTILSAVRGFTKNTLEHRALSYVMRAAVANKPYCTLRNDLADNSVVQFLRNFGFLVRRDETKDLRYIVYIQEPELQQYSHLMDDLF